MNYFRALLSAVLCLSVVFVHAQKSGTATVSGTVRSTGGEAVSGITVSLKGASITTVTDENGKFLLKNIQAGTYTLQISSVGYTTLEHAITVKPGVPQDISFTLSRNRKEMQAVTITGKSKIQEIKESGFAVNAIETKKYANTTADLNQILNRTTGVRIREQGGLGSDFKFSINGLSGKQVKFFIDGIPMEVMGSAMSLNNIPVNLADRLEVYKGVVPVQLGADAMGGAVNVVTNQKATSYLDVSHSYGSFNTHRSALTGQFADKKTGIIVKASGFLNSSDNNYRMKGVDVITGGTKNGNFITDFNGAEYVVADAKRFHDNYFSILGQLEAGITNKKWADVLMIGLGYNEAHQDLQTGFDQKTVYGKVERNSYAKSATIRYKKDDLFVKGLSLSTFAARSKDTYRTIDTLFGKYDWGNIWYESGYTEMGKSVKTIGVIERHRTYAMANISYVINPQHSLNLNYTLDHLKNENFNEVFKDFDTLPGKINKNILGLAYQQNLLEGRLVNTFFTKYYSLGLNRAKYIDRILTSQDTTAGNWGYGIAARYKLTEGLGIKASYEHAYRLQDVEEVFGDGLNLQGNPDLKPESSDNFNLGAFYNFKIDKHSFYIEASGFYRDAKDFIFPVPDLRSNVLKNENQSSVRITGFESELRYNYDQLFSVTLNMTYQNAINTTKQGQTESYYVEGTYKNKIPNQPWLFGNADFTIGKSDVFKKGTRLQFNWFTQYINWFYLTWESKGNPNGKSDIPTQFVQNASLSYSLQNGRYNISAECRNLTDRLTYDNFRLQKPGRSFFVKFRYFLH
ncbi:TonB-dependent receptor [Pseudobacter ginsenosidimutans]|uniref:Outer membrane receptor protein involved in Fe transport n=1 Tax=Pseudobacter ginsenosidimutans TaxID=661488 RepID=A0A4Q7MQ57_9BACT|nr:TonB-dependent receptor [Pseudobacter ginsenosidimutans]QEC42490.1 TonB-dependent receptor [Pseudobacter ginsenosidimutans]RZS70657.1 outer membrane receptor protein involved in Fe transport [Pseudobacter ginsenosidimutans]